MKIAGRVVVGRGRLSVRAVPPPEFGPLGAPGCAPASPLHGWDVFGTAAGAQLWALFHGRAQPAQGDVWLVVRS